MDLRGGKGTKGSRAGVRGAHTGWEEGREGKKARGEGEKREKPEPCFSALSPSVLLLSYSHRGS